MPDLSRFNGVILFKQKIYNSIINKKLEEIAILVCRAYDKFNPKNFKEHPCFDIIDEGVKELKKNDYEIFIKEFKGQGVQLLIKHPFPKKTFLNSNYKHV
jgi:hypothetical protein